MARTLAARLARLEEANAGAGGEAFFMLWIAKGEDRRAALAAFRKARKVDAEVPVYCAEWTRETKRPRSRMTSVYKLPEVEMRSLSDAVMDDPSLRELASMAQDGEGDENIAFDRRRCAEMTNRELISAFIVGQPNNV